MPTSSPAPLSLGPTTAAFGLVFWPRRSVSILAVASLALWALPIAIGYGVVSLF